MKNVTENSNVGVGKESFGTKMGHLVGSMFVACIAVCLCACMIAATISFVTWIF